MTSKTSEALLRLAVVALLVATVELLCQLGVIPVAVMIAPSRMAVELTKILASGEYSADIASSIGNVLISTVLSVALGFIAGLRAKMVYGDIYFPVFQGMNVRVGRFISIPDIEAQLAPNNYTYVHSLTYTFDNYTNTGI